MLVYRFKPNDRADHRVALSSDQTGANLPAAGAPWQRIGEIDLSTNSPWINAPVDDIKKAVAAHGFFIWSISVPPLKTRFQK